MNHVVNRKVASALLDGRIALVTGGSRGIGAATARALGTHGAHVAVNYRSDSDAASLVVADIEETGGRACAVRGDASDPEEMASVAAAVRDRLGDVDVLVCNVFGETKGVMEGDIPLLDQLDTIVRHVEVQLSATVNACRTVVPAMRRRGGGRIIVVGSVGSRTSSPLPATARITVAKAANDMLARLLAVELGPHNVTVNIVAPGFVPTDANAGPQQKASAEAIAAETPLGRVATPEDVANAVVAYASDLTRHVTGGYVTVDGGWSMY